MSPIEVLRQLRYQQEKHKDDKVPTFGICISDMARDAANSIDELLRKYAWVSVTERLPLAPEYDWVLVKTVFDSGDSFKGSFGVPHVAELRNGVWYCDTCDEPMEEWLHIKVVAWFDMQLLNNYEEMWKK
jgi:hypothetical protein